MAVYAPGYSGPVHAHGSCVSPGFGPGSCTNAGYTLFPIIYDPCESIIDAGIGSVDFHDCDAHAGKLDASYRHEYGNRVPPAFNPGLLKKI